MVNVNLRFKFLLLIALFGVICEANFIKFRTCLSKNGIIRRSVVVRDRSKIYEDQNYQWNKYPYSIFPKAYVVVENEDNVVCTVRCAVEAIVKLVTKAGGHSFEKYSFGDNDTVVIDIRKLNDVQLIGDAAHVGAGLLSAPIIWKLYKADQVFIPVGLCPAVAIGGFASGGGYGHFSRTSGLAVDYLREINIVLANGSLVTANSNQNADLFWALRGGGAASFGVVTKFVFNVIPVPETVSAWHSTYDLSQFIQVYRAWETVAKSGPIEINSSFRVTKDGKVDIWTWAEYGENMLKEISGKFPPANSSRIFTLDYPDFLYLAAKNITRDNFRNGFKLTKPEDLENVPVNAAATDYYKKNSFYVSRVLSGRQLHQLWLLLKVKPDIASVLIHMFGGFSENVANNATAFVHRRGKFALFGGSVGAGRNEFDRRRGVKWLHEFLSYGANTLRENGSYANYADGDLRDYLQRYYGSNLARLLQIKRTYNPTNFFRFPQSIPTNF